MNLYSAYRLKKLSYALVTLVETEQDCLEELFKTVWTTRRMSVNEFHTVWRARVPDDRRVESTARYEKLLSVRGTETKPWSDVRGWSEMVGETLNYNK